jgi:glycosyltransferase involved in cell wall biosynthesis
VIKILHIIPSLNKGGAERLVLNICCELGIRENVKVKLVTFYSQNEYVELTEGMDWTVIPSVYIPSLTGKPTKDIIGLQQSIEEFQPNIIHTHLWEAEMVSRQIHFPKAKWFTHFHDNMLQLTKTLTFSKISLTNLYERGIMLKRYKKLNNRFICISDHTFNYAKNVLPHFLNDNIYLLNNAIDFQRFEKKVSKVPFELKLITVGSLVNKKNHQFLIKVGGVLKKEISGVTLNILGEGRNKVDIEKKIVEFNLENNITLQGNVNEVEKYMWGSSIYVHSATYEPFGLVLLEAMAAGLPVVCLDGKGNRDIIVQGKNGFMVYEENAEVFASKILEIWNNKQLYTEMSEFAKKFANQYDIKPYVDKLLTIYKRS